MKPDASIEFAPDATLIPTVRLILRRALPPLGQDDSALYFGAVTEILANAVDAHRDRLDAPIRVDLMSTPNPGVIVTDVGPGFDPDQPHTTGDEGKGRGLLIARSACSQMTIRSSPSGTVVHLPLVGSSEP